MAPSIPQLTSNSIGPQFSVFRYLHRWVAGFGLMLFMLAPFGHAQQVQDTEKVKINFLLQAIGSLEGAQFIRNGSAYTAAEAEAHLRLKWGAAGKRVSSAEDFIRYCATGSSMSGLPYQIKWSDGRMVTTAAFLSQKLSEYNRSH